MLDGGLVFDLSDDVRLGVMLEEQGAEGVDVGRFADERQSEEIHADFAADGDVGAVLVGEGREVDLDAGQVDVAAAAEGAGLFDLTAEPVDLLFEDAQLDQAIVDQDDPVDRDGSDHLRVIGGDDEDVALRLGFRGARDVDYLAGGQLRWFSAGAGADFGAFDVHHDRELFADLLADFTHPGDGGPDPSVVGVGHVQADDIGSGLDDCLQIGLGFGGRPNRERDAGVAEGLHG